MEGGPFRKPDRGHVKDMITSRFNILVADLDASTKATGTVMNRRLKSGDVTRIQEKFKRPSLERTSSNVKDAKIKLDLIPSPRQRSKSTSEREAMKVIHKIIKEDEPITRATQNEERAEKHKEWILSGPISALSRKDMEHFINKRFGLPEHRLTQQFQRYAALRSSDVRTVKVTSYEIPEAKPRKVRRINMRTYH